MDIATLSLEEKVGQLFIVDFEGIEKSGELIHLITYFKVGGLYYRNNNIINLKKLHRLSTIAQNYAKTGLPLFLATTQEGENNNVITEGVTKSPSQKVLGLANNRLYTKQIAEIVANELRAVGINMNIAPVINTANELHAESCFSDDNDYVAKHGVAAIQGYEKGQVCSVVKYFPSISADNLENLSTIPIDRKKSPLYPFYRAIKFGTSGILVSNNLFNHSRSLPIVKRLFDNVLRNEAKFQGVLLTEVDDSVNEEHILSLIETGIDLIHLKTTYEQQIDTISKILEAVKTGKISEERVDESVKRILLLKKKHRIGEIPPFRRELFQRKRSLDLVNRIKERASVTN